MKEPATYSEYLAQNNIGKQTEGLSEIVDNSMIKLSMTYANQYQTNPKNFISCFLKYQSIRTVCAWIIGTYKHQGIFDECKATGKDFTEYANRQNVPDKWKRVLAEILLIIYSILNP